MKPSNNRLNPATACPSATPTAGLCVCSRANADTDTCLPWLVVFALWLACAGGMAAPPPLKTMKVTTQREGEVTHFFVENLEASELTVTFELELENLRSSRPLPYTAVFPAQRVTKAFSVSPIDTNATWKFSYTSRYTLGSCTAVHDDACAYTLPYAPGSAFRITQGYHGAYSHTGPEQYAIDWKMPVGTPVHAARAGVVAKVKVDSDEGGPDRRFESCANYILVRHDDGTLANYAHLQKDGSAVVAGQKVRAGDLIGYSGNTGFSTGPHLHFAVFKTRNGAERQSVPIKFATEDGNIITLAEGQAYRAPLAGEAVAAVGSRRVFSPRDESIWNRFSIFPRAQGGSRKAK